jgi:hypothetical protein
MKPIFNIVGEFTEMRSMIAKCLEGCLRFLILELGSRVRQGKSSYLYSHTHVSRTFLVGILRC